MNPTDDLAHVPLINGFAVELCQRHIEYTSGGGRIAWFPAWEEAQRDLAHLTLDDIPLGTADLPYDDADEDWHIVIFEEGGFVYIFEADDPHAEEFPRSFRIPRDDYVMAWAALLNDFNPVEPLDG